MRTFAPVTLGHGGRTLRGWQFGTVARNGSAALLVHGFGSTDTGGQQLFVQTARTLAEHGSAVRSYSRLGHGTSDGDFADITIGDEVDQVVAMIRTLAADAAGPGRCMSWRTASGRWSPPWRPHACRNSSRR